MDFNFFNELKNRTQYMYGIYEQKKKNLEELNKEVNKLEKESILLEKTEQVLKHLVDKLVKKDLKKMDQLITYGLNTVFPGKDLKFESVIDEYRGKIRILLKTIYNGEEVDPSSRSSVTVIESFLLRILCIVKLNKAPLLLIDETFPAVDSGYIENVSKLISQLSEKLNIDLLAVTHNLELSENSHNSYKLTSRKNTVTLEKVK